MKMGSSSGKSKGKVEGTPKLLQKDDGRHDKNNDQGNVDHSTSAQTIVIATATTQQSEHTVNDTKAGVDRSFNDNDATNVVYHRHAHSPAPIVSTIRIQGRNNGSSTANTGNAHHNNNDSNPQIARRSSIWTWMRKLLAEGLGTALFVTAVVSSTIAAERLSPNDPGMQLLISAFSIVCTMYGLILALGPISGAHFNPVLSIVDFLHGDLGIFGCAFYIIAQCNGAVCGCILANLQFSTTISEILDRKPIEAVLWNNAKITTASLLDCFHGNATGNRDLEVFLDSTVPCLYSVGEYIWTSLHDFSTTTFDISVNERFGADLWTGELIATIVLVVIYHGCIRTGNQDKLSAAVAMWMGGGMFVTSSSCFANPAVTLGRIFTNTSAGIEPIPSALIYVGVQVVGSLVGYILVKILYSQGQITQPLRNDDALYRRAHVLANHENYYKQKHY